MNRYQRNLIALVSLHLGALLGAKNNKEKQRFNKDYDEIGKLLSQEVPMKLVQESPGQPPTCDNCYNEHPSKDAHYCPNCGQKIDKKKNHLLDWDNTND